MKQKFSTAWKSSKQPRKQRKYIYNAPLHLKQKAISSHLSKELRKKYGRRSIKIKKGDVVKIMVGQFKKKEGKVQSVNLKKGVVYIENVQNIRKDGTKSYYPIHPSNLLVVEVNLDDKKRKKFLERVKYGTKAS